MKESGFVLNQEKADETSQRFLWLFKKTTLRIRDEERGNPVYLVRYSLLTLPWFAVKVHNIRISDDDCLHDHPWSFLSLMLWGGYHEEIRFVDIPYQKRLWVDLPEDTRIVRWYGPLSLLWRPAPWPHRLVLSKPAWTLVVTFKKFREWGFYTSKGWVQWQKYIRSGAKCE